MKRFLFLLTFPIWALLSCGESNAAKQSILTSTNLKSLFITLNADSNYVLKTSKGAIIRIARNSFDVDKNASVKLEIKEAYTAQDILLAGLSTESNGRLLRSGGMIYVNATVNEEEIKLLKPLSISIPGEVYNDKMQLFKGELKSDSSINWVDPQKLDTSAIAKKLVLGKALFKATCASCHKPDKDFTGPALKGWKSRVPGGDWIYKYVANPASMQQIDPYAKAIFNKWNKTQMTAFPSLGKDGVDAIMSYVDNESMLNSSENINTSVPPELALIKDSTGISYPCITNDTVIKSTQVITNSIEIISDTTQPANLINSTANSKAEEMEGLRSGFTDILNSGMYEFSIQTFGWFNVDAFVEGYTGTTYVKINAGLQMEYAFKMHLYLFCPEKKMLSVSNVFKNDIYSFDKIDGKVPLFLNDKAILLAFGSNEGKTFYGTAAFNVQQEQTIDIKIKETSVAELRSFIELNKIDGIKIDATKKEMIYQQNLQTNENVPVEIDILEVPCADTTKIYNK